MGEKTMRLGNLRPAAGATKDTKRRGKGAATGLGGTAPVPAPSPAPWAAAIVAGALCAAAAAYWLRRSRHPARHAR